VAAVKGRGGFSGKEDIPIVEGQTAACERGLCFVQGAGGETEHTIHTHQKRGSIAYLKQGGAIAADLYLELLERFKSEVDLSD